jgi:raffinose/stachyose/melibiose transport system permease protein
MTVTAVSRPPAVRRRRRDPIRHVAWISLTVLAMITLVPFVLVLLNAFKSPADYSQNGPLGLPQSLYFKGISDFWARVDFGEKLVNSTVIAGSVAGLAVLVSILSAYALGIGRVRGRLWIIAIFLLANLMPQEALVYPLYYMAKEVDLYDTRLAVIIIFTAIQSAFGTYLLSSVLSTFPREILDAAYVDGASRWQVLWRLVVPMSWPTLSVLLVFFFIWTWNEFFLPLIFLVSNDNQTVPVALGVLQGQRLMDATAQSASSLLGILPAILFFLIFQRTLTRGVTAGALK